MTKSAETVDLVTFFAEIFNAKLHFLCSVQYGLLFKTLPKPLKTTFLEISCIQLILFFFFSIKSYTRIWYKWQIITSKKLTKENKVIQLVKSKTKLHPTLTSDKYAYCEVISPIQTFENAKICEENKIKRIKGCIAGKALADI